MNISIVLLLAALRYFLKHGFCFVFLLGQFAFASKIQCLSFIYKLPDIFFAFPVILVTF